MKTDLAFDSVVHLAPQRAVRLALAPGERLVAMDGTLWLTFDDDPNDYFLEAGAEMAPGPRNGLVVQSMAPGASYRIRREAL